MAPRARPTPGPKRPAGAVGGAGARPPGAAAHAKSIPANAFHALLGAVRKPVDARLALLLEQRAAAARAHGPEVGDMVDSLRSLCLRGGKRLRAALLVAGYRSASAKAPLEPAIEAGVALELVQSYFLVHDDWMDRDDVRRGGPAVHAELARTFRSRHLGAAAAILAGDYAAALAVGVLAGVPMPGAATRRIWEAFSEMQVDATMGQQLDVIGRTTTPEAGYALKTTSYTVRGPLRLGALLGGGGSRLLAAIDRYSAPLGLAFQLRDDLLNAFGDPATTGKPLGSDLREGKRTPLLLHGLKRARGRDHRLLHAAVGNASATEAQVRRALEVLERVGAREAIEGRVDELTREALERLAGSRLTPEGHGLLEGAARTLTARQR
ncbi:MAG: polyprenyl synthetase family protein [Polyangiaceae bacterium]|nr:polyprenyl synthetase family protein [Polyangiaceae bacterium]